MSRDSDGPRTPRFASHTSTVTHASVVRPQSVRWVKGEKENNMKRTKRKPCGLEAPRRAVLHDSREASMKLYNKRDSQDDGCMNQRPAMPSQIRRLRLFRRRYSTFSSQSESESGTSKSSALALAFFAAWFLMSLCCSRTASMSTAVGAFLIFAKVLPDLAVDALATLPVGERRPGEP